MFCPSGLTKDGKGSRIIASLTVGFSCLAFMLSCSGARTQLLEREGWLLVFAPVGSYVRGGPQFRVVAIAGRQICFGNKIGGEAGL